jgi:flagellar basal body-associated protein FliL
MICPKCGELNSEKTKYCFDCNTELIKPCNLPVADNSVVQADNLQSQKQKLDEKIMLKVRSDDFRSYVDNYVRKETGFDSAQDYLNRKKPMKPIWLILFIGTIILGSIGGIFAINREVDAMITSLIMGVMGLGALYFISYLLCGIINATRNTKKQFISQTIGNKIDVERVTAFLHENMQCFPFGGWHTYKAPILGGLVASNIDIVECVFNNKTIHRIVFVGDESFYKICTTGIIDSTAAKAIKTTAGILGVNNSSPNFYKLYKNSHMAVPFLKAAMEYYFLATNEIAENINILYTHEKLSQSAEPSTTEAFVKQKRIPHVAMITVLVTLVLVICVGIFTLLSSKDSMEDEPLKEQPREDLIQDDNFAILDESTQSATTTITPPTEISQSHSEQLRKELYIDFIHALENYTTVKGDVTYSLIYINDDDIPELFFNGYRNINVLSNDNIPEILIEHGFTSTNIIWSRGSGLLTAYGNKMDSFPMGDNIRYIERENIFIVSGGRMGYFWDRIYRIQNGEFEIIHSGSWNDHYYEDVTGYLSGYQFFWNDIEVTEDEYYRLSSSAFNESRALSTGNSISMSASEIIEEINNFTTR